MDFLVLFIIDDVLEVQWELNKGCICGKPRNRNSSLHLKYFSLGACVYKGPMGIKCHLHSIRIQASTVLPRQDRPIKEKDLSKVCAIKYPNSVAWESVSRESWKGELQVEGCIPHWLVSILISIFHFWWFMKFLCGKLLHISTPIIGQVDSFFLK